MSKVFVVSDLHFGHKLVSGKRGFSSIEEHDKVIIDNWNSVVSKKDTVYLLGDITLSKRHLDLLNELKRNRLWLIAGNHDELKFSKKLIKESLVDGVTGCIKYKKFIMSHMPVHESVLNNRYINLHGHTHFNVINDSRYINVCLEHTNLFPIEISEIEDKLNNLN